MKRFAILLMALVPLPALAQTAPEPKPATAQALTGYWALRADGATIFRFDIERDGEGWKGVWHRPASFASNGETFSRLSNQSVEIKSGVTKSTGEWVELTFPDNRPQAVPDVFRFRLIGPDRAEMVYVDTGLAPFTLTRAGAGTALGPFEAGKSYRRVSIEALGLPTDVTGPPPPTGRRGVSISPPPDPKRVAPLPARRTDQPPEEGGR